MSIFGSDTTKIKLGLFGHIIKRLEKKTFVKPYDGPAVGPQTQGTYLAGHPKPEPLHRFFVQTGNGLWLVSVVALANMIAVIVPGGWMYLFNGRGRKVQSKMAEDFGPTRYGLGKNYHS